MAVVSVKKIHEGRDGSDDVSLKGTTVQRYTDVYRVVVDSTLDDANTISRDYRIPKLGSRHGTDPYAYLCGRHLSGVGFSRKVWILACSYSSEFEMLEDPLAEPAKTTWRTEVFQKAAAKDINGHAIVNTAGVPPDPPQNTDDSKWAAVTRKNVPGVPAWISTYRLAVNNADWSLDGYGIPKGWAKLGMIEIGEWQIRNDIRYRVMTMGFQIVDKLETRNEYKWDGAAWVALGATEFEHAHALINPNVGFKYNSFGTIVEAMDDEGEPMSSPIQLNEFGNKISTPDASTMFFTVHDMNNPMDFSALPTT